MDVHVEFCSFTSFAFPKNFGPKVNSFDYCRDLTKVTLSPNTKEIEAFNGCGKLRDLEFNEGLECIWGAFSCTNFEKLEFPSTLSRINRSFGESRSLKSVNLGDVRVVTDYSFSESPVLEEVIVTEATDSITEGCFNGCASLRRVEPPAREIELDESFNDCSAITEVSVRATTPNLFPVTCFRDVDFANATLYVPIGSGEAYGEAPGWKNSGS